MSPHLKNLKHSRQLFYQGGKVTLEINRDSCWRIIQAFDQILAQKNYQTSGHPCSLLASDEQRSVLSTHDTERPCSQAYSPYGHHVQGRCLPSQLAFNGERLDAVTGCYHLGNGYRQFSPVLMRFCSPDSLSPFRAGGLNAYGYCAGDPTNRNDPTGHFWGIGKFFRRLFGLPPKAPKSAGGLNTATQASPISSESAHAANVKDSRGSFEMLFNDGEIAEQYHLFEKFSKPQSPIKRGKHFPKAQHYVPDDVAAQPILTGSELSLDQHKAAVMAENSLRDLAQLNKEIVALNKRMAGAGSSRDIMVRKTVWGELNAREAIRDGFL